MAIPYWFSSVLELSLLVLTSIMAAVSIRYTRRTRAEMRTNHAQLIRHLHQIDVQLRLLASQGGKRQGAECSKPDDVNPLLLPKGWRSDRESNSTIGKRVHFPSVPPLIAVPTLAAPAAAPADSAGGALGERHAEILALADAGTPPWEIARRTGHPIGQVELVLGLHRRSQSSRGPDDDARPD